MSVKLYSNTGDGVWSSTASTISDAYDITTTGNMGDSKDTFSFKIPNYNNRNRDTIKSQDLIEINFLINGASVASSNLIMNGLVKKVTEQTSSNGTKFIRIDGVSFSEISTNALVFYNNSNVNVMQFLKGCLESVELRNTNFGVTWNSGNPLLYKYNATTKLYDGDSFPLLNSGDLTKEFDQSLGRLLDRYLQDDYTGDGRYYWYINSSKELVIRKRTSDINGYLTESTDFKTSKFDINTDDVRNFIVVKCGYDYDNNPITTRYDDPVSRAKHGFRYYMLVDTTLAEKLKAEATYEGDNAGFREEVKRRGRLKGEAFAAAHNKGFLKIDITMPPTVNYDLGTNIGITALSYSNPGDSSLSLSNYPMRINGVQYDIDGVLLSLEEEVASV